MARSSASTCDSEKFTTPIVKSKMKDMPQTYAIFNVLPRRVVASIFCLWLWRRICSIPGSEMALLINSGDNLGLVRILWIVPTAFKELDAHPSPFRYVKGRE